MRCSCCNAHLSPYDSTIKHSITGEYLDLCGSCRRSIFDSGAFIPYKDRPELIEDGELDDGVDNYEEL